MPDLPGEVLLEQHMLKAEAKFIKAALLKKVYDGAKLTESDARYIKKWFAEIRAGEEETVGATCVPGKHSRLSLTQLTGFDRYKLNSIPLVNVTSEYKDFALADLIFELSHFIDDSFVESVRSDEDA